MTKETIRTNEMTKTRIVLCIELLKTFSEDELNRFDEFINSPFFNTNKKLCLLYKKLRRYALNTPNFTDEIRLKIYKDVFGRSPNKLSAAQQNTLNKSLSSLLTLTEKYIMVEQLEHHEATQYDLLFPELIKREQMLLYNRRLKAIQKKLDSEQKKGVNYYTNKYKLHHHKAEALFKENRLDREDNFDDLQYYYDAQHLIGKLSYHLAKITLLKRYGHKQFNLTSFNALEKLFELPEYKSNILIQLYRLNIKLIEIDDETTFKELSEVLKENQAFIPTIALRPFYSNLTNYCVKQTAKGKMEYFNYLFGIYQDMDGANLFVSDGKIYIGILKNIITIACRVSEFDWAKEKLSNYIDFVPKAIRNYVFHYNQGVIVFNQNKFEEALKHLNMVNKIDDTHDLSLRILRLKSFYETDEYFESSTAQMLHSLKVYLNDNKKLSFRQKSAYYNFISIFSKLYKFKDIPNKRALSNKIKTILPKIKETLLEFDLIREKMWLLNKIEVLENQ